MILKLSLAKARDNALRASEFYSEEEKNKGVNVSQKGIYKRTKAHREEFARNMHTVSAKKKRLETMQKNRELAEKELVDKMEEKVEEVVEEERTEESLENRDDKSNKYDQTASQIKNMDRSKCEDELASVRYEILSKVQKLSDMWKGLIALQERREKLEIRLEETGVNFKDQR